ncbi:hypothetical protein X946_5558 [Burkholderia sp. ABCPW 111]|nr:hypothetical protein X946_5558 [Burkholderia sp. ABCPW 111]
MALTPPAAPANPPSSQAWGAPERTQQRVNHETDNTGLVISRSRYRIRQTRGDRRIDLHYQPPDQEPVYTHL